MPEPNGPGGRHTETNGSLLREKIAELCLNDNLIPYGVQDCEATYCIHVGYLAQKAYLFETELAHYILAEHFEGKRAYKVRRASQRGTDRVTAIGLLIPYRDLHCKVADFAKGMTAREVDALYKKSTGVRGKNAEVLAQSLVRANAFDLPPHVVGDLDIKRELRGEDLHMTQFKATFQVKCDWSCGDPPGFGNIYLQVGERNPFKRYSGKKGR